MKTGIGSHQASVKVREWIALYQQAENPLEHERYTVKLWHQSGSHLSYPSWVIVQIRSEIAPITMNPWR